MIPLGLVPTAEGDIEGRRRIIVDVLGWEWCEEHGAALRRGYNSCAALHTDRVPPSDWPGIRRHPVWAKMGEGSLSLERRVGVQSIRSRYAYFYGRKIIAGDFVKVGNDWIGPVTVAEYDDGACRAWLSDPPEGEPAAVVGNHEAIYIRRLKCAVRQENLLNTSSEGNQ